MTSRVADFKLYNAVYAEAGEVGEEVSKAAIWLGRIGTFFKVLGSDGLVITLIAGLIELIEGAEQYVVSLVMSASTYPLTERHHRKKKLIDAIHGLQPARLTTAFFKQEGENIMQELVSLQMYLDASPGGSDPDPTIAAYVSPLPISELLPRAWHACSRGTLPRALGLT